MNTKRLLIIFLASFFTRIAFGAPATLVIESFTIRAGEEKVMVIGLNNPNDEITLVQFDLRLPEGLSLKQENGEYAIDMCDRTSWRKHSLDANAIGGIIRFLLSSSSNTIINSTEGGIIKINLVADANFKDGSVVLENILLVSPTEKEIRPDNVTLNLHEHTSAYLSIEANATELDGETTLQVDLNNPNDEITLVQFDLRLPEGISLKQENGEYAIDMCDRTSWRKHSLDANVVGDVIRFLLSSSSNTIIDGTEGGIIKINLVADSKFKDGSVVLENILLVSPTEKEIKPDNVTLNLFRHSSAYLSIEANATDLDGETTLQVDLNNPNDEITLVQFDLRLPEGISLKQENGEYAIDMCNRTSWRKHSLDANVVGDVIRFLLSSSSNTIIDGTEGGIIQMTLVIDESYKGDVILIENILLVSPTEKEIKPDNMDITTSMKKISARQTDMSTIYSLSGIRLVSPRKGVNVVGGKKILMR